MTGVKVCGCEDKRWHNTGIHLCDAEGADDQEQRVLGHDARLLVGRRAVPARGQSPGLADPAGREFGGLHPQRPSRVRKCVIEDNVCACPPGAEAGGPTGRRILWFSTGRGSVDLNWIAGNREDKARFGGVAATDQNVGETILFEAASGSPTTARWPPPAAKA